MSRRERGREVYAAQFGVSPEEDLNRRLLLGAYFTMEYAIVSTALFNPSIVAHPNQDDLPEGVLRFIMSLRATGEGHVSSVLPDERRRAQYSPNKS